MKRVAQQDRQRAFLCAVGNLHDCTAFSAVEGPYLFLLRRTGTSYFYLYEVENIRGE